MKKTRFRVVTATLAILLLSNCAAPPAGNRNPRSVALIMSGDFMSYSSQGLGTRVSVVDVDGTPVKEPYGPVELAPGRHTVNIACDGTNTPHTLMFSAGEVYQFAARTRPGAKGCTGALARVRSTNP